MGDFCLSGFHSRVPIQREDKTIAIICAKRKDLDEIDYVPCYVQSPLIPLHIPVVGKMGDYGILDSFDEDVTTKFLQEKVGMDFIGISEIIQDYRRSSNDWNEEHGVTDLFKKLNEIPGRFFNLDTTFTIIYEHYSIYKAMTKDLPTVRESFKSIPLNGDIFYTNYVDRMVFDAMSKGKPKEELDKIYKQFANLSTPGKYLDTYAIDLPGLNYFYKDCDIDWSHSLDSVIDWCSFIRTLEYMNGEFTFSMHAGQTWHFDEEYVRRHQHLHQLIACLYERLLPEDYYD